MIRTAIILSLAFAVNTAFALTNMQTQAEFDMELFGGSVRKPGSARGKIVFINAQKRLAESDIQSAITEIEETTKADCVSICSEKVALPNPRKDIEANGGQIGVVLIEDANYPVLTVAPEDGWALVNVLALGSEKIAKKKIASRARKELMRAFGLVAGCAFMSRGKIVMLGDVHSPRDLDSIKEETYGVDAISTMEQSLPKSGINPWIVSTYEDACQEGWAPPPTNKWQKAVWDKVHAPPEKPLKITFDKEKQKPVVK